MNNGSNTTAFKCDWCASGYIRSSREMSLEDADFFTGWIINIGINACFVSTLFATHRFLPLLNSYYIRIFYLNWDRYPIKNVIYKECAKSYMTRRTLGSVRQQPGLVEFGEGYLFDLWWLLFYVPNLWFGG